MEAIAWVIGIGIALYLLFRFPRKSLWTAAIVAGLALLLGGSIVAYSWWTSEVARKEKAQVELVASATDPMCNPDFPISVTIQNRGNRKLSVVSFELAAKKPGYSDKVYSAYGMRSDKIIEPQQGWRQCWSLDKYDIGSEDPKQLDWTATASYVTFDE